MPDTSSQIIKDLVFCLQSYLYWFDVYESEGEWSALQKETEFRQRLEVLLPKALTIFKHDDFDTDCG